MKSLGSIVTDQESKQHVGIIYLVILTKRNKTSYYVGSKQFSKGEDWKSYQTSSSNKQFKKDIQNTKNYVEWQVLEFVDNSRAILPIENKWINRYRATNLLNRSDAYGNRLQAPIKAIDIL